MKLKNILLSLSDEERELLAHACGHSLGHIMNVARGYKPCSAELATALEQETARLFGEHRKVMRWDLIPTKWWRIWPELVGQPGAPSISPLGPAANDPQGQCAA